MLSLFHFKLSEFKALISLAIPILFSQFFQMGMGITDIAIAGHHGDQTLAAVAVGVSIWHPIMFFVSGVLMSCSILCAHAYGAREMIQIPKIVCAGLYVASFFMITSLLIMQFPMPILLLFNVKQALIAPTGEYLNALSLGMPAMYLFFILLYITEGVARPRPLLITSMLGFIVNGILNYALTNGIQRLSIPELGVFGSGMGTAITFWIMLITMFCLVKSDHRLKELKLYSQLTWPIAKNISAVLKLGLPNGATIFAEITIFSVALLMLSRFSNTTIGSHQIALNISGMAFMIPLSLSFALAVIVGQTIGSGDKVAALRIGYMGICTCLCLMLITASILYFGRFTFPKLFTENPETLKNAAALLIFAAIFQIPDGLQVSSNGTLRGIKDTKIPMFICIFSYWLIGIPLGYVLGVFYNWQAQGVWIGLIFGLSSAAIMLTTRFYFASKKSLRILSRPII